MTSSDPSRVWDIHLEFSADQWKGIQAKRVEPLKNWTQGKDGALRLLNTNASRNGLSGVLGFDFPWSTSRVDFAGVVFTNTAIRFKGNGTFLDSVRNFRKPFKIDLGRGASGRRLAGRSEFNLANLTADRSCLSDTLGYEFYREAGVPAPRTTFVRVFLDIEGATTNRLIGPYLMVENPDEDWVRDQLGNTHMALFKPVTMDLFLDLGPDWSAYRRIYDPKTAVSPMQTQRLMDLARLVTHAPDDTFAREIGNFIDLEEFSRFLACEVILSNLDGLLANGQNFLLYHDPRSNRFGFIPWDLDHCWGEAPFLGTAEQRTRASLWHPWVGTNRFLERMLQVEAFRQRYRGQLEHLLETQFIPDRLSARIDVLAAGIRPLVEEWSPERLSQFDIAVSGDVKEGPRDGDPSSPSRPVWQLKRFINERATHVRAQLNGSAEGQMVTRQPH